MKRPNITRHSHKITPPGVISIFHRHTQRRHEITPVMWTDQEGVKRFLACRSIALMKYHEPTIQFIRLEFRSWRVFQRRKPISLLVLIIISWICRLPIVSANDDDQDLEGVNLDDYINHEEIDNGEEIDNDWYMILLFSLIFGFVITLFGSGVVYFSFLEDALMRRYRDEGDIVRATVMAATFVRSGDSGSCCSQGKTTPELIAFIEYNRILAKNYTVRVRKQIKVREDDLIAPAIIGMPGGMMNIRVNMCQDITTIPQNGETNFDDNGEMYTTAPSDLSRRTSALLEQSRSEPNIGSEQYFIDVLVLPYHVQSAYPKKKVERACSFQSMLSTSILIGFIVLLATFCTALALDAVLGMENEHRQRIGCYAIGFLVLLIALEVPLIHFCLHSLFMDTLRAEYLERGEFVPVDGGGSSSLSSKGSDMNFQVPVSLSTVSLL